MNRALLSLFLLCTPTFLVAQGVFTSFQTGNWNSTSTWTEDGSNPSTNIPNASNSASIGISHVVTLDVDVTIDSTTINDGGDIVVPTGRILTVSNGSTNPDVSISTSAFSPGQLIVTGTLINQGQIATSGTRSNLVMNANSVFRHAQDGGTIPLTNNSTWDDESTIELTGLTSNAPSQLNQTFGNVVYNCTGQTGAVDLNLSGTSTIVRGDFTVSSTGSSGLVISDNSGVTLTVDSTFAVSGSSAIAVTFQGNVALDIGQDFNYTSSGGSFLATNSGTPGTGAINVEEDFIISSGSFTTDAGASGTITFDGSSNTQNFTGGGTFTFTNIVIASGATLDLGTEALAGSATYTQSGTVILGSTASGGALQASPATAGNIQVSGTRTYNSGASFIYGATTGAQVIGNGFPLAGEANLQISNADGVTTSDNLTFNSGRALTLDQNSTLTIDDNDTITFSSGTLSNNASDPIGSFIGGSLSSIVVSGSGVFSDTIIVDQLLNFDNTRTGVGSDVVIGSDLELVSGGTLNLGFDAEIDLGDSELSVNGDYTNGGGSFGTNSSSRIVIRGSGAFGSLTFVDADIGILELNRSSLNVVLNSNIDINDSLKLMRGTLSGTGDLIDMEPNSYIVRRGNGTYSVTGAPNTTSGRYNVIYRGGGSITTGNELPTTGDDLLNNLTILANNTVTLNKAIIINGSLSLEAGTFDAGVNQVTFLGDLVSNSNSDFTDGSHLALFAGTTTISGSNVLSFNDVDITGTVTAPAINLNVAGDLDATGNTSFTANGGTVSFNGTTQDVTSDGIAFNNFTVSGSTVTLQDSLSVAGALTIGNVLNAGEVANGHNIRVAGNWVNNGTFDPRATGAGANQTVFFAGTSTVSGSSSTDFNSIRITGTLNAPANLNVGLNFRNDGTFNHNNGAVTFNGSSVSTINGTSTTVFEDLNINNAALGSVRLTGSAQITGTLDLVDVNAVFDADGAGSGVLTLRSTTDNGNGDARIDSLPVPANFTGNVTVQRYISGEGQIFRYLGSAVVDAPVSQLQDDFKVTGSFVGASPDPFNDPSMYYYNEAAAGDVSNGWVAFPTTDNSEVLVDTLGYANFMFNANDPKVWDVRGAINKGSIDFGVTYNDNGPTADDEGWNLLANPYPSAIDWDTLWRNGFPAGNPNVSPTINVRDNASGQVATYNASTGLGTNFGTQDIAMGQGFWVQTTGASPSLILDESDKSGASPIFFRIGGPTDFIRIALESEGKHDEAVIHFIAEATNEYDYLYDSRKINGDFLPDPFKTFESDLFYLSTFNQSGSSLAVNAIPFETSCNRIVNLNVEDTKAGSYELNFSELRGITKEMNIYVIDSYQNTTHLISEGMIYGFEVTDKPESFGKERFKVSFGEPNVDFNLSIETSGFCPGQENQIQILNAQQGILYQALIGDAIIAESAADGNGIASMSIAPFQNPKEAKEILIYAKPISCGEPVLVKGLALPDESELEISAVSPASICGPGEVTISAESGLADGSYRWYMDETTSVPIEGANGSILIIDDLQESTSFYVTAVNQLGCESTERTEVKAEVHPMALGPEIEEETVCGDTIVLAGLALDGEVYRWYDGLEALEPVLESEDNFYVIPEDASDLRLFVSRMNGAGCESERFEVMATHFSEPVISLDEEDGTLISNYDIGNQWLLDGDVIEGATDQTFKPTSEGTYSVQVASGSCTRVSGVLAITGISDEFANAELILYPNPASNYLTIEYGSEYIGNLEISVYDQVGRLMLSSKLEKSDFRFKTDINLSELNKGTFVIRFREGDNLFLQRFIKN